MEQNIETIKKQIVEALRHPEAEDGLYFNNLIVVHEDEERPIVAGHDADVLRALEELINQGTIVMDGNGGSTIYKLNTPG